MKETERVDDSRAPEGTTRWKTYENGNNRTNNHRPTTQAEKDYLRSL